MVVVQGEFRRMMANEELDRRNAWKKFRANKNLEAGIAHLEASAKRESVTLLSREFVQSITEWLRELRELRQPDSATET